MTSESSEIAHSTGIDQEMFSQYERVRRLRRRFLWHNLADIFTEERSFADWTNRM